MVGSVSRTPGMFGVRSRANALTTMTDHHGMATTATLTLDSEGRRGKSQSFVGPRIRTLRKDF